MVYGLAPQQKAFAMRLVNSKPGGINLDGTNQFEAQFLVHWLRGHGSHHERLHTDGIRLFQALGHERSRNTFASVVRVYSEIVQD
jgi:hypothetical protein